MPWRYRTITNEHGHPQVVDYSQSPARPVCSDCHLSYTNVIGELACSDCRSIHDEQKDSGQSTMELTNQYGHVDHVLVENGEIARFGSGNPIPVCPQCLCHVMPNRGQGTLCTSCNHDLMIECEHDYADGFL